MAWNELSSLIGGDLHFERDPPMVAPLNKKLFTKEALSQDSYVAMAGLVGKARMFRRPPLP